MAEWAERDLFSHCLLVPGLVALVLQGEGSFNFSGPFSPIILIKIFSGGVGIGLAGGGGVGG
jgi:hypothetical protein